MRITSELPFSVDIENPHAVYVQIENQVQFAIASGKIKKGETLPSVRELSARLQVNPNTVTKAYRDLELLGLVTTRRGVGVTVSQDAVKICRDKIRENASEQLSDAAAGCIASGLTPAQINTVVKRAIDSGRLPYEGNGRSHD